VFIIFLSIVYFSS